MASEDARFEDVSFHDKPLRLRLEDAEDVPIVSALVQDAVGLAGEISWMPRRRRLVLLLNRFRWEDRDDAALQNRRFERVRAALVLDQVAAVRASGLDPRDKDTVYSVLQMVWTPGEDAEGLLEFRLAGDGALAAEVECLEGQLLDLTRPWEAKSDTVPDHALDGDGDA